MSSNRKRCVIFTVIAVLAVLIGSSIALLSSSKSPKSSDGSLKNNFTAAIASNGIECAGIGRLVPLTRSI